MRLLPVNQVNKEKFLSQEALLGTIDKIIKANSCK
jgi:hypothetical protein